MRIARSLCLGAVAGLLLAGCGSETTRLLPGPPVSEPVITLPPTAGLELRALGRSSRWGLTVPRPPLSASAPWVLRGPALPEDRRRGRLEGEVVGIGEAMPVGAQVALQGPEERTVQPDADGRFIVELTPGEYLVVAQADTFIPAHARVRVFPATLSVVSIRLTPEADVAAERCLVLPCQRWTCGQPEPECACGACDPAEEPPRDSIDAQGTAPRPLCPLCRYALEPEGGWRDAPGALNSPAQYNALHQGSWMYSRPTKPTAPQVALFADETTVRTQIVPGFDRNGDALTHEYRWLVDGNPLQGFAGPSIPAPRVPVGSEAVVEVRARAANGDTGPWARARLRRGDPQAIQASLTRDADSEELLLSVDVEDAGGIRSVCLDYASDAACDRFAFVNDTQWSATLPVPATGAPQVLLYASYRDGAGRFVEGRFVFIVPDHGGFDDAYEDFDLWLEAQGYNDALRALYRRHAAHPLVRKQMETWFALRDQAPRPGSVLEEIHAGDAASLRLLELVPTDADSESVLSDELGAELLEGHLSSLFAANLRMSHEAQSLSWLDTFGPVRRRGELLDFDLGRMRNFVLDQAEGADANRLLVHFALRRYPDPEDGALREVRDFTGSVPAHSHGAVVDENDLFELDVYAHEWGHGFGLGHHFLPGDDTVTTERFWGLDCVMNHTYVGHAR